jgi:hypothetical protein
VYLEEHNVRYWFRYSLPVALVIHLPDDGLTIWREVTPDSVIRTSRGGLAVDLDPGQHLDQSAFSRLRELADADLPESGDELDQALRGRRAALDLRWIEELDAEQRLVLDARVARPKGRARYSLLLDHGLYKDTIEAREWSFNPAQPFEDELARLFPWADLAIDKDFYRTRTYVEYLSLKAGWDEDSKDFVWKEDANFDEWFEARFGGGISPWATLHRSGDETWRLELSLNDLGVSMLRAEQEEVYDDAIASLEVEDARSALGKAGSYRAGAYDHAGRHVDLIVVESEGGSDVLESAVDLLRDASRIAAVILSDATGEEPTAAQVGAFVLAFAARLEGEWHLSFDEVQAWLDQVSG